MYLSSSSLKREVIMILYDGEQVFPEQANKFKVFLKDYLAKRGAAYILEEKFFIYDNDNDEFLEPKIQEFYLLWSVVPH